MISQGLPGTLRSLGGESSLILTTKQNRIEKHWSYSILSYIPHWKFEKNIQNSYFICSLTGREEIYTDSESDSKEKKRKEPTRLARKDKGNF
jgi:hypothetical protein